MTTPYRDTRRRRKPIDSQSSRNEATGPLDYDRRFSSPARALKVFARLKKALPAGSPYSNPDNTVLRLYLSDHSFVGVNGVGHVYSSGGLASKAFFQFQLWLCESPKKAEARSSGPSQPGSNKNPYSRPIEADTGMELGISLPFSTGAP